VIDEINDPQPQPDPAWDYYDVWKNLNSAKADIDKALSHLRGCELASPQNTRIARILVNDAVATLRHIVNPLLTPDEPE